MTQLVAVYHLIWKCVLVDTLEFLPADRMSEAGLKVAPP